MPKVPYEPYQSVEPTSPGERAAVSTPPAAFGENIGAALSHLGTTVDQVGGEMWTRAMAMQQLNNESEARELQLQHAQQTTPLMVDFDSLKGKDPKERLPSYLKDLEGVRQNLSSGASNPMVRRMFLNDTAGFAQREIFSAAKHAGDEFKNYVVRTAKAQSDLTKETWTDPNDSNELDEKLDLQHRNAETIAAAGGMGKEQLDKLNFDDGSLTRAKQLTALGTRGETEKAFDLLERYNAEGKLSQEHYEAIQKSLWKINEAHGASFLAKKIDREMPDASPQQKLDKIEELAPNYAHGDPWFLDAAQHQLRTALHVDDYLQRQSVHTSEQTIYGGIRSGKIGKLQDIMADPDFKAAYDALPEGKEKNGIPKLIGQGILARDFEANQESRRYLDGMAHDPTQRREFLKINPYDPKWHLSIEQQDHFLALREKAIRAPLDDPLVSQGWHQMRQQNMGTLQDLGVVDKITGKEKPAQANLLRGDMAVALHEFMDANKRQPSPEEFQEKIAKPLIKTHAEPFFFGMRSRNVPEYATTADKKMIEDSRKELTEQASKAGTDPPTDREIAAHIAHERWKAFFQGSTSEGKPSGGPATAPIPN